MVIEYRNHTLLLGHIKVLYHDNSTLLFFCKSIILFMDGGGWRARFKEGQAQTTHLPSQGVSLFLQV